mmetsp:Transcript_7581/g.12235  ORF Transcript_7581/g.12235 Transcript_7581/m.12235 type:complete len:138 (-) Transcript_7581:1460-1873(-)
MATWRGSGGGGGNNMSYNRNALFGDRGNNTHASTTGQSYAEQTRALYEEENNRQTAVLGDQVSRLKELSLQINGEVNTQNDLLSGMSSDFSGTGQLMSNTLKKLQHMIDTGGSKHMCYLILFVVGLFFFVYFIVARR